MQTITVDMTPGFRQPTIHYSQNDVGTTFAIDLRSRFGDTLPASPTVKIQATKPSGFGFSIEADSVVGSLATFTTVDTMTDEAGRFQAELQIIKDAVVIYTANFYMEGEANPHPIGTTDGSQGTIIPTLTLLVERVEAAAASVLDMTVEAETLAAGSQATYSYDEDTNTATFGIPQGEAGAGAAGVTASAYSSSKTYAVGDYVIHNSNLYRCTTAITTAEAFTAAHWTQVVLGDDVSDLKSAISLIGSVVKSDNLLDYDSCTIGEYIKLDGGSESNAGYFHSAQIDVKDLIGQTIYFYRGQVAPIAEINAAFVTAYDSGGNAVSASGATNTHSYTVPNGVASVVLSFAYNSSTSMYTMVLDDSEAPTKFIDFFEPYYKPTNKFDERTIELEESVSIIHSKDVESFSRRGSSSAVTINSQNGNTVDFKSTSASGGVYIDYDGEIFTHGSKWLIWCSTSVANSEGARIYLINGTTDVRYVTADLIIGHGHFATFEIGESETVTRLAFICRNSAWDGAVKIDLVSVDEIKENSTAFRLLHKNNGYEYIDTVGNIPSPFGWFEGKLQSFIGDSNTAYGRYQPTVRNQLGMDSFVNCGVSGTSMGGSNAQAMWQDTRVNALSLSSDIVSIMGGTNDAASGSVPIGTESIENYDTSTFIGAFNALISKILYKFCKSANGYYSNIDYSGVTQVATAKEVEIFIYTPIYSSSAEYQNNGKLEQIVEACKVVGAFWNIPVIDCYHLPQFNAITADSYYQDGVHLNLKGGQTLGGFIANQMVGLNRRT